MGSVSEVDGHLAERLHAVGVERHAGRDAASGDLGDRLQRAHFVVDPHHRHDRGTARERGVERVEPQRSAGIDREDDLLAAKCRHGVRRREDRLVLDGRDGHPARTAPCARPRTPSR